MSLSFVMGNLLGRALLSFALVWIVCLLVSRLDWRARGRAAAAVTACWRSPC
jgi:hypothetical protein